MKTKIFIIFMFLFFLTIFSCAPYRYEYVEPEIPERAPILLSKKDFTQLPISVSRGELLATKYYGIGYLDYDMFFKLPGTDEIFGFQISGKHPKLFRRINTSFARIRNLKWYIKKKRVRSKKEWRKLKKSRFLFKEGKSWYLAEAGIYVFRIGKRNYTLITDYTDKNTLLFRVRWRLKRFLFEFPFAGHQFYINYKTKEIGVIGDHSS